MSSDHKSNKQLIEVFISRGMKFADPNRAVDTLRTVSYYKIKEFAQPFADVNKGNINYKGIYFEKILSRYYQDKNLRIALLHAIEDIEVALQTQISHVLGSIDGDGHAYLTFSKWCNKKEYCKHYLYLKENSLKRALMNSNKKIVSYTDDGNKYPPIWVATHLLTFGQLVSLLELMSTSNLRKISRQYQCSNDQLISWLKTVNLVRNLSAHNSNIIDLKLKTMPILKPEWKKLILKTGKHMYSNRISVPIIIIKYLINQINPKYNFSNISEAVTKLCEDDQNARYFGFTDQNTIHLIDPKSMQAIRKIKRKRNRFK